MLISNKSYFSQLQEIRRAKCSLKRAEAPEVPGLIDKNEIDEQDTFIILQLDHGQLMHVSNKVYYNRGVKMMTEQEHTEKPILKENDKENEPLKSISVDDDFDLVPLQQKGKVYLQTQSQEKTEEPPKRKYATTLLSLPSERSQDYFVDDRQLFWRPYGDDLLKLLLTQFNKGPRSPKIILAADMPRPALIHMMVQMSNHRKLSFLGEFKKSEAKGSSGRKYLESKSSKFSNIFEIIDERFYFSDSEEAPKKIDLSKVFGSSFSNSQSQVIFIGQSTSLKMHYPDQMLPPLVIPLASTYDKNNILHPDRTNYAQEMQKIFYLVKKALKQ